MPTGLVDQDIQPSEYLRSNVGDAIDLTFGIEGQEAALIEALCEKTVLFTTSRLPVTEQVLQNVSSLELVAKIGTGLDNIDLDAARKHGVTVLYTPGLNALSVAEHALALLLAVNRNIVTGQKTLETGGWRDVLPLSRSLSGKTVGIIGFGNVGRRLAGLLAGFHVDILAHDPYVSDIETQVTGAELISLDELLTNSNAVVVTAELTDETRHLINRQRFKQMKETATFINTARGPIVDQDALIDAVAEGVIAGAGLDVFETEPLPSSSPVHTIENIVITPHIGGSSIEARKAAINTLVDIALKYFDDEPISSRFIAIQPE